MKPVLALLCRFILIRTRAINFFPIFVISSVTSFIWCRIILRIIIKPISWISSQYIKNSSPYVFSSFWFRRSHSRMIYRVNTDVTSHRYRKCVLFDTTSLKIKPVWDHQNPTPTLLIVMILFFFTQTD